MFTRVLMRCGLRSLTRVAWSALSIVLMLEAVATDASAQSPVCHAIRRGESATQAARRVTGNGQNAYQTWFQIMNPSSRLVPKSQYNRIHAGWRACVITPAILAAGDLRTRITSKSPRLPTSSESSPDGSACSREVLAAPAALASADAGDGPQRRSTRQPAVSDVVRRLGGVDLTMLWLCAAMVVPWLGWRIVDDYLARRKTASLIVRHFVHRFVDEFERPLVRYDVGERPVRSRSPLRRAPRAIRHSSRAGRGKALSEPVGPQEERRIRRGPGRCACSPMTPS